MAKTLTTSDKTLWVCLSDWLVEYYIDWSMDNSCQWLDVYQLNSQHSHIVSNQKSQVIWLFLVNSNRSFLLAQIQRWFFPTRGKRRKGPKVENRNSQTLSTCWQQSWTIWENWKNAPHHSYIQFVVSVDWESGLLPGLSPLGACWINLRPSSSSAVSGSGWGI